MGRFNVKVRERIRLLHTTTSKLAPVIEKNDTFQIATYQNIQVGPVMTEAAV